VSLNLSIPLSFGLGASVLIYIYFFLDFRITIILECTSPPFFVVSYHLYNLN
jgi:hypothetical protein